MSNTGLLGSIVYQQETATGELATTATTYRIPHIGMVDISKLTPEKAQNPEQISSREKLDYRESTKNSMTHYTNSDSDTGPKSES